MGFRLLTRRRVRDSSRGPDQRDVRGGAAGPTCRYLLLQLLFDIVLLNGDLTISLESFVELVPDVPFHAVFCASITDAADMGPKGWERWVFRAKPEQSS